MAEFGIAFGALIIFFLLVIAWALVGDYIRGDKDDFQ